MIWHPKLKYKLNGFAQLRTLQKSDYKNVVGHLKIGSTIERTWVKVYLVQTTATEMIFNSIKTKWSTKESRLCWLTNLNLTIYHTYSAKIGKKSTNITTYPRSLPSHMYWLFVCSKALKTCCWELIYSLKQALWMGALARDAEITDVWLANKTCIFRRLTVTPLERNKRDVRLQI